MYKLTDNISDKTYDDLDRYDLEDKLNEIFDRDAHAYKDSDYIDHTIGEVIDDLLRKLDRNDPTDNEEACLNIVIA